MRLMSASVFKSIVESVATDMYEVVEVSVSGFEIDVTFRSRSGKTHWHSYLCFDQMTGNYTYTRGYPEASLPWAFGDRVLRRMMESQG